jgi:hypothetical protein
MNAKIAKAHFRILLLSESMICICRLFHMLMGMGVFVKCVVYASSS